MIFNLVFLLGLFAPLTLLATPSQAFIVSMSPSMIKTKISLPSFRAATVLPPRYSLQQPLFLSSQVSLTATSDDSEEQDKKKRTGAALRNKLRQVTGFSMTAFRATARAATGISLSAIYASTLAATGLWIRYIMSKILSIFPPGFRYFLQPFLVFYYAPLFILRGLCGPNRNAQRRKHERIVEGWKEAVEFAEVTKKGEYWPVHVDEDGVFEAVQPPKPFETRTEHLADAVAESVEQAMQQKESSKDTTIR